ncbi:MAG: hypothetical protein PHE58_02465 [Candidatus Omnitrophica bacterium]|nr:hypothetical protein [Candidatus Omnitrophota bacterium]
MRISRLFIFLVLILVISTSFLVYQELRAQCGCPCGEICTSVTSVHRVACLPFTATWEGSCCDGGPKQVNFTCLPFTWQGRQYTCLPADVRHDWQRFDGCVPCPPPP